MQLELDQRNVVVTGGSRGIGLAIAQAFREEGASCLVCGRNPDDLKAAAETAHCSTVVADVTTAEGVAGLSRSAQTNFGGAPDILVCNVGSGRSVPPGEETIDEWHRVFEVNLFSAARVIEAFAPTMAELTEMSLDEHDRLLQVNPRAEVPVLVDGGFTVIDSTDIVYYLEDRFPTPAVFPAEPKLRAKARRWQRVADTLLDAIIHDVSIWSWPTHERPDEPPEGLLQAGRGDLHKVLTLLENSLGATGFVCGDLSIADFALFPHISALKPIGIVLEEATHPRLLRWNRKMRSQEPVRRDLDYVKRSAFEKFGSAQSPYESQTIVWRSDRIEWLLAHGFHEWLLGEIQAERAVVPRPV